MRDKQSISGEEHLPRDGVVVDATMGHGGHSLMFGTSLGPAGYILGLDIDEKSIQRAQATLNDLACKVVLVRENFADIEDVLQQQGIEKVDLILADLGFCSAQMNDPERGLSFQQNMPLDMRLDDRLQVSASDIINQSNEKELADTIYMFGQERASRKIARYIVEHRRTQKITTTGQLAAIVCRALKQPATGRRSKIHPATKTFQALRIAVNDELGSLRSLLLAAPKVLRKNGYVAIISFHSLEDKIVKDDFKQNKLEGIYEVLTKKPLTASRPEIEENPRARSAKLRIARRI